MKIGWGAIAILAGACLWAPGFAIQPLISLNSATGLPPDRISETAIYSDPAGKRLAAAAIPFDVNSPLWSDGTVKRRFLALPSGTRAKYARNGEFDFPEGALFIKEFSLDTLVGDSSSRVPLETRLLLLENGVWHGFTYRWDFDGKDASLASLDGEDQVYRVYGKQGGKPEELSWRFPSQSQCNVCHIPDGRQILGFLVPQLNRVGAGGTNALQEFTDKGVIEGVGSNPGEMHRWHGLQDSSVSLGVRARSYLAANCSNCHGDQGMEAGATYVRVNFDYLTAGFAQNYLNMEAGRDLGGPSMPIIAPGRPDSSMLVQRMRLRDGTNQMPPLGSHQLDSAALQLVSAWIRAMGPANSVHPMRQPVASKMKAGMAHDAKGRQRPSHPASGFQVGPRFYQE